MHNYKQVNEFDAYPGGRRDDNSDQEEEEEEDFIQQQIRGQRLQMQEQDAGLEMLGQSAQRLGQLSLGISEELGHQNKMLDEMEDDLDTAATNVNFITKKTRALIKQSGGKKTFLIIISLVLVVIILLFLIVYS